MKFEQTTITLKNGMTATLQCPEKNDAKELLDYITQACAETDFLLRYPEEWSNATIKGEEQWIEAKTDAPDALLLICRIDGRIVGNCEITRLSGMKLCHRATVGIAVLRDFWGLGLGTAMFQAMFDAAHAWQVDIVELELIEDNDRARQIYEKLGFTIVAKRPNAFKLKDGSLHDEIFMQKYL